MSNSNCYNNSNNNTDGFHLQRDPCPIKDPLSDVNNARYKTFGRLKNYSRYEIDATPYNSFRFWIQGSRNPIGCDLSQPYVTFSGKNDTIDYMSSCSCPKYDGYNRNGRFYSSMYTDQTKEAQLYQNQHNNKQ
jgi:hypothetical protein